MKEYGYLRQLNVSLNQHLLVFVVWQVSSVVFKENSTLTLQLIHFFLNSLQMSCFVDNENIFNLQGNNNNSK